jgi:hypothetical protein
MSFRWTEHHVRGLNIPYALGFNRGFNAQKGALHGVDRDNLPSGVNSIDHTMIVDGAFQKWKLARDIAIDASMVPTYTVTSDPGTTYGRYRGGWHIHLTDSLQEDWIEGTLWLMFNCWAWRAKDYAAGNRVWFQFALLFNGAIVLESDKFFLTPQQVHLEAVIPVASGSGKVEIAWRCSSAIGTEASTDRIFTFGGGKLLALNRYR